MAAKTRTNAASKALPKFKSHKLEWEQACKGKPHELEKEHMPAHNGLDIVYHVCKNCTYKKAVDLISSF